MEFKDLVLLARAAKGGGGNIADTYLLLMSDGKEIPAVVVEEETVFTATANDIREGKVAATESGVTTGTKVIPSYNTVAGYIKIPAGQSLEIPFYDALGLCEYTEMQAIVCEFENSSPESVSAVMVVINNNVYAVGSNNVVSKVSSDVGNKKIVFGISNESEKAYVVRYFLYKEIH